MNAIDSSFKINSNGCISTKGYLYDVRKLKFLCGRKLSSTISREISTGTIISAIAETIVKGKNGIKIPCR